jgi:hypothetical protein
MSKLENNSEVLNNILVKLGNKDFGGNIDVTADIGQTVIVKEVDGNNKPIKWEAADYQMRTHGYEFVEVQPSVEITPFYNEEFSVPMEQFPSEFDIVIGEKYKVIFDGVEYICKASLASMGNISAPAFGNALVTGGADTGEPFAIFKIIGGTYPGIIFLDMNTHTVSVFETETQKIPTEFIPSAEELFIHTKEILPEVEAIPQDGCFVIPSPIFFIQNAEYIINYNGIEYEFIPGESSLLDYPFLFYAQENGIVLIYPRDDVTSVTISIKEKIVEKIPEDCLPDIKTSDLTNDSGFITSNDVPVKSVNGKTGAVTIDVPTKTSD